MRQQALQWGASAVRYVVGAMVGGKDGVYVALAPSDSECVDVAAKVTDMPFALGRQVGLGQNAREEAANIVRWPHSDQVSGPSCCCEFEVANGARVMSPLEPDLQAIGRH